MKCTECGTILRRESMFCMTCGKPINALACYIVELRDLGKSLTRRTDLESINNIITFTKKIFAGAASDDELKLQTRDIMEHYLPMLTDVIGKYREAKKGPNVKGEMAAIENDLTDVLNTTERAFEIMVEEMHEKDIEELKVNIEVLKNKIARDGLLDSDFDISE